MLPEIYPTNGHKTKKTSPGTPGYDIKPSQEVLWLGRQDSNLGMPESKSGALPLGDAPSAFNTLSRTDTAVH